MVSQRDRYGMFYTTQATVLALKALLLAAEVGGEAGDATVTISLNGERTQTLTVNAENADVVQQIRFDDLGGDVNDFLHGWLNYQIEHHLFPDLPPLRYRQLQPKVKARCEGKLIGAEGKTVRSEQMEISWLRAELASVKKVSARRTHIEACSSLD